jgi:hypothetical protein
MSGAETVRCLPVAAWPTADRLVLERARRNDDLLEDAGAFAHLRPVTLRKRCSDYGRWLHFLTTHDPAALELPAADRVTRERVAAYHAHLAARNAPITVANRILGLELMARACAPEGSWRWLRRLVNRLFLRAKPVRNRRARLRPPQEVFAAALRLMETVETGDGFTSDKKRAQAYRDALLLAILAVRGPRVASLGCIEVGRQLVRTSVCWELRFGPDETKNGDPFEPPLPEELTLPLDRYYAHWRPLLLGGARSNHFFISANGRPLLAGEVHSVVTTRTKRVFGVAMNPHCFRAALMTEIAIRDPGHVGIASTMLGHRASASGRHYNLAGQHEVARDWQGIVLRHRRGAKRRRR